MTAPSAVRVIDLSPDDPGTCIAVAEALHRAFYSKKSFHEILLKVTSTARDARALVLVAVNGPLTQPKVVGTLTLRRLVEHGELHAGDLYVDGSLRKLGVGTLLAGHGIARAKKDFSADRIFAQAEEDADQWLIDFYERLGFLLISSHQKKYVLYL
jgi:GNAT superfamily N-acetyltransferase